MFIDIARPMLTILELDGGILYAENDSWKCEIGGAVLPIGIVFEAVNLNPGDAYPYVVDACLIPRPEHLDGEVVLEAKDDGAVDRADLIMYVYEYYGGVPVNIDAVQPAKASCGFSSFLADSEVDAVDGGDMEVRHFRDLAEALKFTRDFYAVYATGLFAFIDRVLDNPLRSGGSGRDKLGQLARPNPRLPG